MRYRTCCAFLLLLILGSCNHPQSPAERERLYENALVSARRQSGYPVLSLGQRRGMSLRLGMRKAQVKPSIDSLRQRNDLVWHLSTGDLPIKEVPCEFADERLVILGALLPGPGLTTTPTYQELVHSLGQTYGKSYYHGPNGPAGNRCSWFAGSTEVQLIAEKDSGYLLTYVDVHYAKYYDNWAN